MAVHVMCMAFINVAIATIALVPVLLYGLGLQREGWRPIDVALFGAMIASTDAVAVSAVLKSGEPICCI